MISVCAPGKRAVVLKKVAALMDSNRLDEKAVSIYIFTGILITTCMTNFGMRQGVRNKSIHVHPRMVM
jgi:hypothetical protein